MGAVLGAGPSVEAGVGDAATCKARVAPLSIGVSGEGVRDLATPCTKSGAWWRARRTCIWLGFGDLVSPGCTKLGAGRTPRAGGSSLCQALGWGQLVVLERRHDGSFGGDIKRTSP